MYKGCNLCTQVVFGNWNVNKLGFQVGEKWGGGVFGDNLTFNLWVRTSLEIELLILNSFVIR